MYNRLWNGVLLRGYIAVAHKGLTEGRKKEMEEEGCEGGKEVGD